MTALSEMVAARLGDTFLVRVLGRGTLHQSPAFRDFVASCLDGEAIVVVDLNDCSYLDSTFLGCLIGLSKLKQHCVPARFVIYATPAQRTRLFSTTMLDRYLDFVDDLPPIDATYVSIEPEDVDRRELGEHIMHCHRRLAELGGETASMYRAIADRIAHELDQ